MFGILPRLHSWFEQELKLDMAHVCASTYYNMLLSSKMTPQRPF